VWSSVLVLALLAALNPLRLGLAFLVISRPRPAQNLLAFWVGCLIVSLSYLLVPLMALHFTPMFSSFAHDVGTPGTVASSTVRHIQIGSSAIDLRADDGSPSGASAGELGRAPDGLQRLDGSAIRRVLGRAQNAWQTDRFGSHW